MFGCRHLNSDLRQKPCLVVVICDHQISAYTRLNLYIVSVVAEFCDTPKSQLEYFVRYPVWSGYRQDFVVLGVKCVLNKVCSAYCTSPPSVQVSPSDMPTSKISFNAEDFNIKSDLV